MTRPARVYLDSSDFSRLSNPKRSSAEADIAAQLQVWADAGVAQFLFSGAHLAEMAPLNANFTPAAAARADLVVGLCGRNALLSFDRVVVEELKCLQEPEAQPPDVVSTEAEWFPDWGNLMSPVQWVDAVKQVEVTGKESGLNRQQRRLLKRQLFKKGQPKQVTRSLLVNNWQSGDYQELLERYPMREEDARVLGNYVLGNATAAEANHAFLQSLRDPRWMMRWFANHHDKLTPFIEWLRAPAQKLLVTVNEMSEAARTMRELQVTLGPEYYADILSADGWAKLQDEIVQNVVRRALEKLLPTCAVPVTAQRVDTRCPGLSTFLRSIHSAIKDSTTEIPRRAYASDFADGVHAMYAPYVDIFRADSYMAAHVQKCVARHGTTVVPKLTQLVAQVEAHISQND